MDADAFGTAIMENLLAGVDEYTRRMAERMRRKAPVSKDRAAGPRTKTYRVRPRAMGANAINRYTPINRADRERQQFLLDVKARERKEGFEGARGTGKGGRYVAGEGRLSEAINTPSDYFVYQGKGSELNSPRRFVYAEGPLKGKSPDELRTTNRGALRGVSHHQGGRLRDSIHYVPARVEGGAIVGGVSADAEYAKYVEYGFIHHGSTGRRVKAQPFFRPIWKENQVAGAARLARYVKKAGR